MWKSNRVRALMAGAVSAAALGMANRAIAQVAFNGFSSTAGLMLNGDASGTASAVDGTVLRLTPSAPGETGSAFTRSQYDVSAGFSTFFTFRLNTFDNSGFFGADGFVFTVQDDPRGPAALGAGGGFLGFDTDGTVPAITNSYGIEFDTFQNTESDINSNHVALDVGGSVDHGLANGTPVDPIGQLRDSRLWYAWIDYTGSDVQVRLSENGTRPTDALLDLPLQVFKGLNYYVGFTAGTGSGTENHDILNWQFTPSYDPYGSVTPFQQAHANGDELFGVSVVPNGVGQAGDWSAPASWQELHVPTNATDTFLDGGNLGDYTMYVTSTAVAQSISMSGSPGSAVSLNVIGGGKLGVGQNLNVGYLDNSVAAVTVDGAGSTLTVLNDFTLSPNGNSSTTSLTVSDSGTLNDYEGFIGLDPNSTANATVIGVGSTWNNVYGLHIGEQGGQNASLDVFDGGAVNAAFVNVGAFGTGTLLVDGAGSQVNASQQFFIGQFSFGTMVVQNGGAVSGAYLEIGGFSDSSTVVFDGIGTTGAIGVNTLVGYQGGSGELDITDGAVLVSSNTFIADVSDGGASTGVVHVDGAGSLLDDSGGFTHVGFAGNGTLSITNGGVVHSSSAFVGELPGSTGAVSVGSGSAWTIDNGLYVGGSDTAAGGTAAIAAHSGATLTSNSMQIWSGGTVFVRGILQTGDSNIDGALIAGSGGAVTIGNITGAGAITAAGGTINALSIQTGSLVVSNGFVQVQASGGTAPVNVVHSLSITGVGQLDLGDNDLIFENNLPTPSALSTIQGYLAGGFNFGGWNGAGIISTSAQFDRTQLTALGYADNAILGLTMFDGVPVDANSILVKYTYYGDANLDGVVNVNDFQMFLDGLADGGSSWMQGDFTYDGQVDLGNDFYLFLISYLNQGGSLGELAGIIRADDALTIAQKQELLAVVPEPATIGLMIPGVLMMRRWRRLAKTG